MQDNNWDLINGSDAHDIEVLNYSNQINVIEALFRFVTHHSAAASATGILCPNSAALRELHHAGTLFLLEKPGAYRDVAVHVGDGKGNVVYTPPTAAEVPALMAQLDIDLATMWHTCTPIHAAAFVLWRINWIHPFKNGNGRTARAFAYACLCLKYGLMLPGTSTVIDLITRSRDRYQAALRAADSSWAATGVVDLTDMESYLEDLAKQQLASAPIPAPPAQPVP